MDKRHDHDTGQFKDDGLEDVSEEEEEDGSDLAEFSSDEEEEEGDEEGEEEDSDGEEGESGDDDDDDDEEEGDQDWETDDDEDDILEASDSDSGETEKCPICLNRFRDQDVGTPEACDHQFCLECIQEWAKNVNTCPVDRQVFRLILCKHSGEDKIFKRIPVEDRNTQAEEEEETYCEVCGQCDREDRLLLCDGCDQGYHMDCLTPPLSRVPVEEWFCPECADREGWAEEADDYNEMQEISAENETNMPRRSRRQIPRTLVSERVRSAIEEIRVRRTRNIRRIMSSSEEEEEEEEEESPPSPAAAAPAAATTRKPAAKRKTTTRRKTTRRKTTRRKYKRKTTGKRKTTKTKKTPTKRKTKRKTTKTKRKGVKRKGKRRRRKVTKKARTARAPRPLAVTTVKSRIADSLGLVTPPKGSTIPLQRQKLDKGADTSLSIFGARDELIHFEDEAASPGPSEVQKPSKYSRMALSSCQPIGRVPVLSSSKAKEKRVTENLSSVTASSGPVDLLGSIMQSQTKLHLQSRDITIQKDGSLLEKQKEISKPKTKPKISFSIGKSSPTKTPGSIFKTSPRVISPPSLFHKPDHNMRKEAADNDKPGMPASHGSMGFQPNVFLNEEYDPAHPTDELEEIGAKVVVTKMVQDDDKYDPFHPTDDLESDDDNKVVSNISADLEDKKVILDIKNSSLVNKSYEVKQNESVKEAFDMDENETAKTRYTSGENFEAASPEHDNNFDESAACETGKAIEDDDDDKSTDLEDEYAAEQDKVVILINHDKHVENKQQQNPSPQINQSTHKNKKDTLQKGSQIEVNPGGRNTSNPEIELRKPNEKKKEKEEKNAALPKPGFHGGLPQVLLPHQLTVMTKPSEKDKTKEMVTMKKENENIDKTASAVKKVEPIQKIIPVQKSLDFAKRSQYKNKLLYGEVDFTKDVTFSESGFPQQFEVNLKRIEDAFKDTKVEEDLKDDVEIVEEVPQSSLAEVIPDEKLISLSDSESRDEQEMKEISDDIAMEKVVEPKETDNTEKEKSRKHPEIQVEYIKKVKVKKSNEIPIDIEKIKDKKVEADKKADKARKPDKKSSDKEIIGKKSKSKGSKQKSDIVNKAEKENKTKKKSKRKVSVENDFEEDEDELSYRKQLQEIREPKEKKKKDSKRKVKGDSLEERDRHKGKKSSEDGRKSKHEKKKSREDSYDKKSRDTSYDKRKLRDDSYERTKTREDSYDRRRSRDDSHDRRRSRADSYDRKKSRDHSHDRRRSRDDSYDRRKSRDDSYDRRRSRADSFDRHRPRGDSYERRRIRGDSFDRRKSREDSHERRKSRADSHERRRIREDSYDQRRNIEESYEYPNSLKKSDRHRKSLEDISDLSDDYRERKDKRNKHKLPEDAIKKSDHNHREKGREKKKTKDKQKRVESDKLKLLSVDYESISEDEIESDIDEKHDHWSEIEEGELKDEYWYKENIKPDRRERERKMSRDDRENRTMFYQETEDGEILYSDKSKLLQAEKEIDTRIVIQVTQDTENRRVWEEDEKRKKKHKKEMKEKEERNKERNKDSENKKGKKSKRHRSKSSSEDYRARSRSKEKRKRSRSRTRDKPKKKRRDHSRSHSRDKLFRSLSRSLSKDRSFERSNKKKHKNKASSRDREKSWDRSRERSDSLDMEEIYGGSEKSWSKSPFIKRHASPLKRYDSHESVTPEKEDPNPVSQTLMGSILKQETGESLFSELNKRKLETNKAEINQPAKKKTKTDGTKTKSKKKKQEAKLGVDKIKAPVQKTRVIVPPPPTIELNRKESPIIIQDDKEDIIDIPVPDKKVEKFSDSDDEPEETEQFSYTDRDEYLLQNKSQQQHTNLIRIVHDPPLKPPSPPSPAPPMPVPELREGPTPPISVMGEPIVPGPFPPPPPGPPPGMILTSEGPPVHVQVSGPPGQGILGEGTILIRSLPPQGEAVSGGPQLIPPGPNIPVGINVLPPGFAPGLPQPLRPQRPVLVNAFMNQPPPGFPRLPGSPGPVRILQAPISSQIPSPGAQMQGTQVVNGPFEGLPHEGPPNVPPPGYPPGEPRHIVQISTDTPPPNLVPMQHELEGPPLGPPPRSLPLPIPPEPHLIQINSNPHDPRLPIPLHLPPPASEPMPDSVIVSVPPNSVIVSVPPPLTEPTSVTPLQDELFSAPSPDYVQEPNVDANAFIRVQTPPNSIACVVVNSSPNQTSSAPSIPGLGDLDTMPAVSRATVDTSVSAPDSSTNDELPIFSQLEEISKLLNVQAKLKIISSQEKRKTNIVKGNRKGDGVFKVPLPPGQKSGNNGGKGDSVESNEVTDMDMGSPIDEEGNIELPVSPQYENLIDKPEDLENDLYLQKQNEKESEFDNSKEETEEFDDKFSPIDDHKFSPIDDNKFSPIDDKFSPIEDKENEVNDIFTQKDNKKENEFDEIFSKQTDKQKIVVENKHKTPVNDKPKKVFEDKKPIFNVKKTVFDDIFSDGTNEKEDEELEDIQDSFENKLDAIGLIKDIEALTKAINAETLKKDTDLIKDSDKAEKKSSSAKNKDSKHTKENKHKHHHHKHKTREEKRKTKDLRLKALSDAHQEIDSQEMPSSAVEMTNKEKYLKKLHLQERVVEEVKMAVKPHYANKDIDKDQYKEILRKAVPKICHSKSGDINPMKIKSLVEAYVSKYNKSKTGKSTDLSLSPSPTANGEKVKLKTNR